MNTQHSTASAFVELRRFPEAVSGNIRGAGALALVIGSFAYGTIITAVLPLWSRMAEAAGGTELQERLFYGAEEARRALAGIHARAETEALTFYALDVPNAVLYTLGMAAMMAFGLRQLNAAGSSFRFLLFLPLLAGVADLLENACLASALLLWPNAPDALLAAAGMFTGVKLAAGLPAQATAALLALGGLAVLFWRRVKKGSQR